MCHVSKAGARKRSYAKKQTHRSHGDAEPVVKCPHCEYQTNKSAGLSSHSCNHHGDALQAERPDRKSDMSNLKLHSRKHTGAMLQCMYCRYKTTRSNTLKTHLRIHTGDKLQCPHCHYKTAFSSDLSKHLRRHTGGLLSTIIIKTGKTVN